MSRKIISQPTIQRIQPRRVRIPTRRGGGAGDPYVGPLVFKVLSRDELGRPKTVEVGFDDSTFQLEQGTEFFTGFIHATAAEPQVKGRA